MAKPEWVAVFDLDGTCISHSRRSLCDVIRLNGGLTKRCRLMAKGMVEYYFSLIHDGNFTEEHGWKWLLDTIDLYIESHLTVSKMEKILQTVRLRDGVEDCLKMLRGRNIPVAIISYGFLQFIEITLKVNKVSHFVDDIYGTKFKINKKGLVVGFEEKTVVLPERKGIFSKLFADKYGVARENILAVGDSSGDRELGFLKENRFGITEDPRRKEELEKFMGTVAVTKTFDPVTEWFERKIETPFSLPAESADGIFCANSDCGKDGKICSDCGNFMPKIEKIGN